MHSNRTTLTHKILVHAHPLAHHISRHATLIHRVHNTAGSHRPLVHRAHAWIHVRILIEAS